jgi:ABC-type Fe3+/spermidine/putrescine transport system ATPase subunit
MALLQLHQISKSFADTPAVNDVSLSLIGGQIICLLGPSGCGKTTLLRLIAGLETPDTGQILFEDQEISSLPPHRRGFGLMFQEFALFPHKNVGQNVAFGLQMKQEVDVEQRVQEMLALVGLNGFERRDIHSLSGGERQRVALARSLAPNPRLLMLDEPLGALDRALRERLMVEIRQILKKVGLTAIYVTHDQSEAFAIADRIAVMNRGYIEQEATPEELYRQPATPFVAQFLGFTNLLEATHLANNRIETVLGIWPVGGKPDAVGQKVSALIRPEAASLEPFAGAVAITGQLVNYLFRGRFYQITIATAGQYLTFEMPVAQLPPIGNQMTLWLDPLEILLLPSISQ